MRIHVLEYAIVAAFLTLASSGLYIATPRHLPAPAAAANLAPFHCYLPPGVSAAEAGCKP